MQQQIAALERQLAGHLVQTPYVRLLAIPGINAVSAAELAAESSVRRHIGLPTSMASMQPVHARLENKILTVEMKDVLLKG